jgi:hypothetical protein
MSNYFERLAAEAFRAGVAPRTKSSMDWFRRRSHKMNKLNRNTLMEEKELIKTKKEIIGSMAFFHYDPKHKDTLPYYDRFPLTVIVGPAKGGFYGLNLHYLPPILRAKLLDALQSITNNRRYDESTKFALSYKLLKSISKYRYFKPCFKHYLSVQVKSNFSMVQAPDWEIAVFLPVADFRKAGRNTVYKDSRKMLK